MNLVQEVELALSRLRSALETSTSYESSALILPLIESLQDSLKDTKPIEKWPKPYINYNALYPINDSMIPWKIRAARKRALHKITKKEQTETSSQIRSLYVLSKNKSEGTICGKSLLLNSSINNGDGETNNDDICSGYVSDVCDYNISPENRCENFFASPRRKMNNDDDLIQSKVGIDHVDRKKSSLSCENNKNPNFRITDTVNYPAKYSSDSLDNVQFVGTNDNKTQKQQFIATESFRNDSNESQTCLLSNPREKKYNESSSSSSSSIKPSSFGVKGKIDRKKKMAQANLIDNIQQCYMSDQEYFKDSKNSNFNGNNITNGHLERTNWNSRFSNIKLVFDNSNLDDVCNKSRSPSINRFIPNSEMEAKKYTQRILNHACINGKASTNHNIFKKNNNITLKTKPSKPQVQFLNPSVHKNAPSYMVNNNLYGNSQEINNRNKMKDDVHIKTSIYNNTKSKTKMEPMNQETCKIGVINSEPHKITKKSDMDYQEYMNIINKVRQTKEFTRIRAEKVRLASKCIQKKKNFIETEKQQKELIIQPKGRNDNTILSHRSNKTNFDNNSNYLNSNVNKRVNDIEYMEAEHIMHRRNGESITQINCNDKTKDIIKNNEMDTSSYIKQFQNKNVLKKESFRIKEQGHINDTERTNDSRKIKQYLEKATYEVEDEAFCKLNKPLFKNGEINHDEVNASDSICNKHDDTKDEETLIRIEKINLIHEEERLLQRQEDMLSQIELERYNLSKQENLIRSWQDERLKHVRREKLLLEKQEEHLRFRQQCLNKEREHQEQLKIEQKILREQKEAIKRRQNEIMKELLINNQHMKNLEFNENQNKKINLADNKLTFIKQKQQIQKDSKWIPESSIINKISVCQENDLNNTCIKHSTTNSSNCSITDSSDEDTLDNDNNKDGYYHSKVAVIHQPTSVPVSIRTIEVMSDNSPWSPITPYLHSYKDKDAQGQDKVCDTYDTIKTSSPINKKYGNIITSPESTQTSTNVFTTPENSWSIQSQRSLSEPNSLASSCNGSPPPIPPLPILESISNKCYNWQFQMPENIICNNMKDHQTTLHHNKKYQTALQHTKSCSILSPNIGGPGSAFKPYNSNENLNDISQSCLKEKPPLNQRPTIPPKPKSLNGFNKSKNIYLNRNNSKENLNGERLCVKKSIKTPFSTTDTESEMKECNCNFPSLDCTENFKNTDVYVTSEIEEGDKVQINMAVNSDMLIIQSPPQITQKPVGMVKKPVAQSHMFAVQDISSNSTDVTESSPNLSQNLNYKNNSSVPKYERIQKSDSIIEIRPTNSNTKLKQTQPYEQKVGNRLFSDNKGTYKIKLKLGENKQQNKKPKSDEIKKVPLEKTGLINKDTNASHRQTMSEALVEVDRKKEPRKVFALRRTNPTIAAMEIMTRKEEKALEMKQRMAVRNWPNITDVEQDETKIPKFPLKNILNRVAKQIPKNIFNASKNAKSDCKTRDEKSDSIDKEKINVEKDISFSNSDDVCWTNNSLESETRRRRTFKKKINLQSKGYTLSMSKSFDSIENYLNTNKNQFDFSTKNTKQTAVMEKDPQLNTVIGKGEKESPNKTSVLNVDEMILKYEDKNAFISADPKEEDFKYQRPIIAKIKTTNGYVPSFKNDNDQSNTMNDYALKRTNSMENLCSIKSRIESYLDAIGNQGEDTKKSDVQFKSQNKQKLPRLLQANKINSQKTFKIYAQSATENDCSAEEETAADFTVRQTNLLQVPAKEKQGILQRSKTFASTGQFESSLSHQDAKVKQQEIMKYFLSEKPNVINNERKNDDEIKNVEEIFEKLLCNTTSPSNRKTKYEAWK